MRGEKVSPTPRMRDILTEHIASGCRWWLDSAQFYHNGYMRSLDDQFDLGDPRGNEANCGHSCGYRISAYTPVQFPFEIQEC